MVISSKTGSTYSPRQDGKTVEFLLLEWFETNKRILNKKTDTGRVISLKFLGENPDFKPGDILFEDDELIIVADIAKTETIVIRPRDMQEIAAICYEIGNKHLPLFYQNKELLVAFEKPLYQLFQAAGFDVITASRKLTCPLKTTVAPHGTTGTSLFNRIMRLTTDQS